MTPLQLLNQARFYMREPEREMFAEAAAWEAALGEYQKLMCAIRRAIREA
jgi:hypothetical protein